MRGYTAIIASPERKDVVSIADDVPSLATSSSNHGNHNMTTGLLDFAIIGFEKTGTTFLLKALGAHPEVLMPYKHSNLSKKICTETDSGKDTILDWLSERAGPHVGPKHGIKCSGLIQKTLAIEHLADISDETKLIVGVRHPIPWFESFYNYR